MSHDPAVTAEQAAAEAVMDAAIINGALLTTEQGIHIGKAAVAAARPIIEAEVRERIAADIVAHCLSDQYVEDGDEAKVCRYCYTAASIARGTL